MKSYKILFVDDDEFIRKIYTDRLEASGFDITTASSGALAKEAIEKNTYELICLDYMLADLTGFDILNWIRKDKKLTLPVIIFSASGQEAQMQAFMDAGATEYIQKDHVVPSELAEKFKKIIDSK
jgi:DNA-binding response OmpR family regulator